MARKSKYSGVIDQLPKLPTVAPERRDIVEAVKSQILAAKSETVSLISAAGDVRATLKDMSSSMKSIVDSEIQAVAGRHWASEYARVYAELRYIRDQIKEWESNVNLLLDAYTTLMLEQFEVEGISSLKMDNGQPVATWLEPYAQVVDREALRLWCLKQGLERSMHIHPSTLTSLTKQMLLRGDPEPDGVRVYAKPKIRLGSGDDD